MPEPALIMSPAKVLLRLGNRAFRSLVPPESAVITSGPCGLDADAAAEVMEFDNYAGDDTIPLRADEAIVRHGLRRIVVLAEPDVLRGAQLRERHGLPGQLPAEALCYRDKVRMKRRVAEHGIDVAAHRTVSTALDLCDAVRDLGYPCVLKPPHGRGSADVHVLAGEADLRVFLGGGPFSDRGRSAEWIVEEFVEGDQYRVDGVYDRGQPVLIAVAQYVNTHLDYLRGGHLGSVIVPVDSDEHRTLTALAREVVEKALPPLTTGAFHLEAFRNDRGWVFSEVGARLGGGSIPQEIALSFGVDVTAASIRAQLGLPTAQYPRQRRLAGQLHVSPRPGRLVHTIPGFVHPAVRLSEIAEPGREFTAMSHTNAEFARAVFAARTIDEARDTIRQLVAQIEGGTTWSTADTGDA